MLRECACLDLFIFKNEDMLENTTIIFPKKQAALVYKEDIAFFT